jgi:hypothetical protein
MLGPDGEIVFETQTYYEEIEFGPVELPLDGTYTLLISGSYLGGEYEMSFQFVE